MLRDVTKDIRYPLRKKVLGKIVTVLDGKVNNRGLNLILTKSRVLCKNEIHEIIITDDINAEPGMKVDSISYIGFVAIIEGGVVLKGDHIYIDNKYIGRVVGFDETHFPNHLNIVVYNKERLTGIEYGIDIDSILEFKSG